jgi:23S rRNA (adenine2030-N6)-methyltransferase
VNYRHAYHAGNFADVLKHVVLVALIERLAAKGGPLFFLDTHAGGGRYPLGSAAAERGGEWRRGIGRLSGAGGADGAPPPVARYLELIAGLGGGPKLESYPGSPLLALAGLRPGDRAAFCELERGEASALRRALAGDARAQVHERDGYEALGALLPPAEKRGLVLIDPPYEAPGEFERLAAALGAAAARWREGVFAAWYPIVHGAAAARFLGRMQASGLRRQLIVELCIERDDSPVGLNGAGLLLIRPPWQIELALGPALAWLREQLAPADRGRARVSWHVPE